MEDGDRALIRRATQMYKNWIETRNVLISRMDAEERGTLAGLPHLSDHAKKMVRDLDRISREHTD